MGVAGKHILITGASGGIGRASARLLAADGARLTLLCRDPHKAQAVLEEVRAVNGAEAHAVLLCDMASLASVRAAAEEFLQRGEPLHILLNNAGLINTGRLTTVDGYEEMFAVNHLAPFMLTGLLLPRLLDSGAARIVNVSSGAHAFCKGLEFDDLQSEQRYKTFPVYGKSKLANILFTRELAARLAGKGVTCNALHPGAVGTGLGTQNNGVLGKLLPLLLRPFFKSAEQGAATSVFLCRDDSVASISGQYFVDCRQAQPKPWALDDAAATRLWQVSEQLTGFSYSI